MSVPSLGEHKLRLAGAACCRGVPRGQDAPPGPALGSRWLYLSVCVSYAPSPSGFCLGLATWPLEMPPSLVLVPALSLVLSGSPHGAHLRVPTTPFWFPFPCKWPHHKLPAFTLWKMPSVSGGTRTDPNRKDPDVKSPGPRLFQRSRLPAFPMACPSSCQPA